MPRLSHEEYKLYGVYAVTDERLNKLSKLTHAVEQALQGGACMVQYRDKFSPTRKKIFFASALRELCEQYGKPLIVNDDIDVAKQCGAAGVHIGKNDDGVERARTILGNDAIIGVSCYGSLQRAINAQTRGASYVAFGSVFASPSKPDASRVTIEQIRKAGEQITIPICAIGGITKDNVSLLVEAGVEIAAVISGIFAQRDIKTATQSIAEHFH